MKTDTRTLTRTEVFNLLVDEYRLRFSLQSMTPDSPDNFMDIAQRKAIAKAVQETEYRFNNQESFLEKLTFSIPEGSDPFYQILSKFDQVPSKESLSIVITYNHIDEHRGIQYHETTILPVTKSTSLTDLKHTSRFLDMVKAGKFSKCNTGLFCPDYIDKYINAEEVEEDESNPWAMELTKLSTIEAIEFIDFLL